MSDPIRLDRAAPAQPTLDLESLMPDALAKLAMAATLRAELEVGGIPAIQFWTSRPVRFSRVQVLGHLFRGVRAKVSTPPDGVARPADATAFVAVRAGELWAFLLRFHPAIAAETEARTNELLRQPLQMPQDKPAQQRAELRHRIAQLAEALEKLAFMPPEVAAAVMRAPPAAERH